MEKNFKWLNRPHMKTVPMTFGIPWTRGELEKGQTLRLKDQNGNIVPSQIKPTAYWPEGSVKWVAMSALLDRDGEYSVEKGIPAQTKNPITALEKDGAVIVDSSLLHCEIGTGEQFLTHFCRKGMQEASAQLTAFIKRKASCQDVTTENAYRLTGRVNKVTLEENGPIRVVVKVTGDHFAGEGGKNAGLADHYFRFALRLYFYADSDEIKIVHTFGVDLDQEKDLLGGIGLELNIPVSGEQYNRHIAYACEDGLFYEACRLLFRGGGAWFNKTYLKVAATSPEVAANFMKKQLQDGEFIFPKEGENEDFFGIAADNAYWNRYLLEQNSETSYMITKQTHPECASIPAAYGTDAKGAMFVASPAWIGTAAIKDFKEKAPRALELSSFAEDTAKVSLWLYNPYAPGYDFSAYDLVNHDFSYEGRENDPVGIANTNEIYLKLYDAMPGKQAIIDYAADVQTDLIPVLPSDVYQKTEVFGTYWCDGVEKEHIDNLMKDVCYYYVDQIKERNWYGFWDYGDVMHTYSSIRHCWNYDIGGFAWHNTELCNTYVEWLTFLRTLDPAIYHEARAMTRHCSEVDVYHFGKYQGLGSRHSVRHWGDCSKEPRMAMAGHNRFYYYLTADERVGDIMNEVLDVDIVTTKMDGLYSVYGRHEDDRYGHHPIGPTWSSFLNNWMTAWERTGDTKYRDYLLTGIHGIAAAPLRLCAGSTFHYDRFTKEMLYVGEPGRVGHTHQSHGNYQMHMTICFGAPESYLELNDWLKGTEDEELLADMMEEFGEYAVMTPEERYEASKGLFNEDNKGSWGGAHRGGSYLRFFAYVAMRNGNKRGEEISWNFLHQGMEPQLPDTGYEMENRIGPDGMLKRQVYSGKDTRRPVTEIMPQFSTIGVAQACLNYMEVARFLKEMQDKKQQ